MRARHILPVAFLVGVFGVAAAGGQEAIPNWSAPATWTPTRSGGVHTLANITSPLPFIGVTPCRVADTRGNGFAGAYGPPALVANATRSFTITGQCGIPANAAAVSFNFGALNVGSSGDLRVFPAGAGVPLVSTLNYNANTPNIANAAIVPLGTGGAITVQADAVSIDLIIDLNGYYAAAGTGSFNTFLGVGAGNFTMTGDNNTGFGHNALFNNTTGNFNTATGQGALFNNTTGVSNTATGEGALVSNSTGGNNTATGAFALFFNSMGINNTAVGVVALQNNTTGGGNTATGSNALFSNTTGASNTATGQTALFGNTTGNFNTASGNGALGNTTGSFNIGIGSGAGGNLTTGSNNIDIGNAGVAGESATIRIGTVGTQTATFVAGVNGVTTGGTGTPVLIDSNGQLGTVSSSARFKDEIQDMGDATEGLLRLRPVTFRYKAQPEGRTQFGLIAEEVEKVMPELVVCSPSGEVETVLYHEMPAMLLNELQKQQREVREQQQEIQELKSELAALRTALGQK